MSNQQPSNTAEPKLFTLILLISFASVGATLFAPGLPMIEQYFHVNMASVQLTITLYLVGYAFGQLLYGPLSNRFGRKPTLYFGLSIAIISTILCALSAPLHSFDLLVIARLFMALGASVGLKITFTMIADTYNQAIATKIISRLLLAFAMTPGIGITIGGFLVEKINWQSCFYFLAAYGVVLFILCMQLPETNRTRDLTALQFKNLIRNYSLQLKNSRLILCALLLGCSTSVIYIFAALAPFIGMKLLQLNPSQYGLFNLLPPVGMILGSFLASFLAHKMPANKVIIIGIFIALVGVLIMLLAFLFYWINDATLFLPMIVITLGLSLVFANTSSVATSQATDKSNASAMINFINMGLAVACVFAMGFMPGNSAIVLPMIYAGLMVAMLGLYKFMTGSDEANGQLPR